VFRHRGSGVLGEENQHIHDLESELIRAATARNSIEFRFHEPVAEAKGRPCLPEIVLWFLHLESILAPLFQMNNRQNNLDRQQSRRNSVESTGADRFRVGDASSIICLDMSSHRIAGQPAMGGSRQPAVRG
jgi:hypothetical protein